MEESKKNSTAVEDSLWDHAYEEGCKDGYEDGHLVMLRYVSSILDAIYGKNKEEQ